MQKSWRKRRLDKCQLRKWFVHNNPVSFERSTCSYMSHYILPIVRILRVHMLITGHCECAGTERCHEAATKLAKKYDIVVNIQGDEPLIDPGIIDDVVRALQNSPDAVYR